MAQSASPSEVFHRLVSGVAQGRWDELPDLYAEATHVEHPFDPMLRLADAVVRSETSRISGASDSASTR